MRLSQIKAYLAASQIFAIDPVYMETIVNALNTGDVDRIETLNDVQPRHGFTKVENVGVVKLDGAMIKRNTEFNALCGSMIGYEIIESYIAMAEKDDSIDTILFDIDTNGGEVEGLDDMSEKIFSSDKRTATFYRNKGASAGIYGFSAADEIYAAKTTMLGSIGAVISYEEPEENNAIRVITSRNAPNKRPNNNEELAEMLTERVNTFESFFYERLERNTGMTADQIKTGFKEGGMITAEEAKNLGFVKEVLTYDELLSQLVNRNNQEKGEKNMQMENNGFKFDRNDIDASEKMFNTLQAGYNTSQSRLQLSENTVADLTAMNESKDGKIAELNEKIAQMTTELSEAKTASVVSAKEDAALVVAEAFEHNVGKETAIKMVKADTKEAASQICLQSQNSNGGAGAGDINMETVNAEDEEMKYAMAYAESLNKKTK